MAYDARCRDCEYCRVRKGNGKVTGIFGDGTDRRGQGGTVCATRC